MPRVEVVKDAVAEAHPLVGDHLADLGGVGGGDEGVREVDKLSGTSTTHRLLGPREGPVDRVVFCDQNIPSLRKRNMKNLFKLSS